MRVRLPTIDVDTTFGQVLGRNTISTGAVAVISVDLNPNRNTIFPFAIPGGVADRTHLCLTTADDPGYLDPCDAPEDEQLSFADVTEFGYPLFGSNPCGASEGTRIERNLIRGFDHAVTSAPFAGAPAWLDQALCNDGNYSSRPYTLNIEEGDGHKFDLDDGLIDGNLEDGSWDSNGQLAGRLSRGSNRINIEIYRPDDTPLWNYFNANGASVCGSISDHDALIACLDGWSPGDGVIFTDDLADAYRFGWAPQFYSATLPDNSNQNVESFRPVYIQTAFWYCHVYDHCKYIHDPGEPLVVNPGSTTSPDIEAVSLIQIPLGALPASILDMYPGSPGALIQTISQ
jgi:hypothetical protein